LSINYRCPIVVNVSVLSSEKRKDDGAIQNVKYREEVVAFPIIIITDDDGNRVGGGITPRNTIGDGEGDESEIVGVERPAGEDETLTSADETLTSASRGSTWDDKCRDAGESSIESLSSSHSG
jgi:hypothetical protein